MEFKFDSDVNKSFFDQLFFEKSYLIKKNSKEHVEFWTFLRKYQALSMRRDAQIKGPLSAELKASQTYSEKYNLPRIYDKSYRFNFVIPDVETASQVKYDAFGNEIKQKVPEEKVKEFKFIVQIYLDFMQKEKVNASSDDLDPLKNTLTALLCQMKKLAKLRQNQFNMPVYKSHDDILKTIRENQVTVIAGDTGCGKSTQIPRYLLEAGLDRIVCTQPRRIACMSLAKRVGYETLNEFGSEVAYQVRFEKTRTRSTKILFITEGVLLRQIQTDPDLEQYNLIAVDEVHERHVFTDFLLGILKCLTKKRKDLKVILMSATINIDLFSNYFDEAVVIKIPGRTYRIDVEYMPVFKEKDSKAKSNKIDPQPYLKVMGLIDKKYQPDEHGDLLIFLSGYTEIQTILEAAKEYAAEAKNWIILPLHSMLSIDDQDKVFDIAPEGVRKCILSTNIAETSVTIDGLRFIIDSGKVKEMTYDSATKLHRLKEVSISKASAEQRKGRAGRTGPGVCFRLYSEAEYAQFSEFTTPEIKRVPLSALILQMISMGLKNVRLFPFIEPPSEESIDHALMFLIEQNALTYQEELTNMGRMLSNLPVDIQVGKMLIMATIFDAIEPVVSIAAALSVQSPFVSNLKCNYETMNLRKDLISEHGDPLTLLNAYNEWIKLKDSNANTTKWCKSRGVEEQRFYEISKLKKQFYELLQENDLLAKETPKNDEDVKKDFNAYRQQIWDKREKKRLIDLKRELTKKPKRPRRLLVNEDEQFDAETNDGEEEDEVEDVRNIDFKLDKLNSKSSVYKEALINNISFLKIILTCGLYPHLAVPDEHNNYKRDSDQMFHTRYKMFACIHPTSVFSYDPDFLLPAEDGFNRGKLRFSTSHSLLAYVNLFETNKTYLMNCMKVPALHSLLICSKTLETNSDFTRILFDRWLEIRFLDAKPAQAIISMCVDIRKWIEKLLVMRLNQYQSNFESKFSEESESRPSTSSGHNEADYKAYQLEAKKKIVKFLQSKLMHSLRCVLPAELNTIYKHSKKKPDDAETDEKASILGGPEECEIGDYIKYNCLVPDDIKNKEEKKEADAEELEEASTIQQSWQCEYCFQDFSFEFKDQLKHQIECEIKIQSSSEKSQSKASKNLTEYFCIHCEKKLKLTPIEILKHKKTHE